MWFLKYRCKTQNKTYYCQLSKRNLSIGRSVKNDIITLDEQVPKYYAKIDFKNFAQPRLIFLVESQRHEKLQQTHELRVFKKSYRGEFIFFVIMTLMLGLRYKDVVNASQRHMMDSQEELYAHTGTQVPSIPETSEHWTHVGKSIDYLFRSDCRERGAISLRYSVNQKGIIYLFGKQGLLGSLEALDSQAWSKPVQIDLAGVNHAEQQKMRWVFQPRDEKIVNSSWGLKQVFCSKRKMKGSGKISEAKQLWQQTREELYRDPRTIFRAKTVIESLKKRQNTKDIQEIKSSFVRVAQEIAKKLVVQVEQLDRSGNYDQASQLYRLLGEFKVEDSSETF